VIGLTALLACSTPISFEPQFTGEDDELPDTGVPADAGVRDAGREAGAADAGRDGGAQPVTADCDLYEARACPQAQPSSGTRCMQIPPPAAGPYCYYRAQAEGQVQVAECRVNRQGMTWVVEPARCSYRCATDLPPGGNFFSLLTGGCGTRAQRDCRTAQARTSQEGVDRFLRDLVASCGLPANFRVGVTFNDQGCAEWLHYQAGPRITNAQSLCLSNQLEAVRFECDVSCALTPSTGR
jgi:hypothetical protein